MTADAEMMALIHDMRWCAQQLYDGKKGEMLLANAAAKLSLAADRLSAPVPRQDEVAAVIADMRRRADLLANAAAELSLARLAAPVPDKETK